jgi:hypothetical protein
MDILKKNIFVYSNSGRLALIAECIYKSEQIERFRVSGKNRSIVLQTNYPLLKAQNSKKKIDWKLIEGTMSDVQLLQNIINELEYILKDNGTSRLDYIRSKK